MWVVRLDDDMTWRFVEHELGARSGIAAEMW